MSGGKSTTTGVLDGRSPEAFTALLTTSRARAQRALRCAVVGGAVGLIAVGAGIVLLVGADGSAVTALEAVGLVLTVLAGGCVVAALLHLLGGGRTAPALTAELGYDTGADRVKRAVFGHPQSLSSIEQVRAGRYAALGAVLLPAQVLLFAGVALGQFGQLVSRLGTRSDGVSIGFAITGIVSALLLVVTIPTYRISARRFRAYALAHSVESDAQAPAGPKEPRSARWDG